MLRAYAAGVNAFIETGPLPAEFALVDDTPDRWEPWDCLAVFKGRHILMGVSRRSCGGQSCSPRLARRRRPSCCRATAATCSSSPRPRSTMPTDTTPGLISPASKTRSERCARPIRQQQLGAVRIEDGLGQAAHGRRPAQRARHSQRLLPEPYRLPRVRRGRPVLPGVSRLPHFGHNANVAWCVTHAVADYQDVYVERFRNGPPLQCRYGDGWDHVEVRREVLSVRAGEDVEIDVVLTRHGPVIAGDPGVGPRDSLPVHLDRRPQSDRAVHPAHAARGRRRRARRGAP